MSSGSWDVVVGAEVNVVDDVDACCEVGFDAELGRGSVSLAIVREERQRSD